MKFLYEIIHICTAVVDESEIWSSQWIFQFKQLERRSLKKKKKKKKKWLIKFYLIKNTKGKKRKFASTVQISLLNYFVMLFLSYGNFYSFPHFTVSCAHLFVFFPNNLNYRCQQMGGAYKKGTVINTLIPECDKHLISPFTLIPESNIKVMRIKEMINNWRTPWLLNRFSLPAH